MNITLAIVFSIVVSFGAFLLAGWLYLWIKKQESVNVKINSIGALIKSGANTFLRKEYTILAKFALVAFVIIVVFLSQSLMATS